MQFQLNLKKPANMQYVWNKYFTSHVKIVTESFMKLKRSTFTLQKTALKIQLYDLKYVYARRDVLRCNNCDKIHCICFFKSTLSTQITNFLFSTTFPLSYRAELNSLMPMRTKNISKVACFQKLLSCYGEDIIKL